MSRYSVTKWSIRTPVDLNRLSKVYASVDVSKPESETSIPFVVYGSWTSRLPL